MPSSWSSETQHVSFRSLEPQIQWITVRSLRWSCSKSEVFGPHVLCFTNVEHSHAYTGRVHLATHLRREMPGAHHVTHIAESGLHLKLGAFGVHLSHWSAVDGPRLAFTLGADVVTAGRQSTSDAAATAPLVNTQLARWALDGDVVVTFERKGYLPISLGDPGQHWSPRTRSSSCWHGTLYFPCQPSMPSAWRYTPPGCPRWAPGSSA